MYFVEALAKMPRIAAALLTRETAIRLARDVVNRTPNIPLAEPVTSKWQEVGKNALLRTGIFYHQPSSTDLGAKQQTVQHCKLDPFESDHHLLTGWAGQLLSYNIMMRGRGHNNAFGQHEDTPEYMQRIGVIMSNIVRTLGEYPNARVIALQEAPIGDDADAVIDFFRLNLPNGWVFGENTHADTSKWGVTTIVRGDETMPKLLPPILEEAELDPQRCRTISDGPHGKITNLHLPHSGPEPVARALIRKIIIDMLTDVSENGKTHLVAGDFNVDAELMHKIIAETLESEIEALNRQQNAEPVKIEVDFEASQEGHLKADGRKLTVDCVINFRSKKAEESDYKLRFSQGGALAATVVGAAVLGTAGLGFVQNDGDEAEEAPSLSMRH